MTPESSALPPAERRRTFPVILTAGFLTLLDVSIGNIALPSLEASLNANAVHIQFIVVSEPHIPWVMMATMGIAGAGLVISPNQTRTLADVPVGTIFVARTIAVIDARRRRHGAEVRS